jgi:hypothetical protein
MVERTRRRKLQDIIRDPLEFSDPDFVPEVENASDRSAAILIGANVERGLERLLLQSLVRVKDEDVIGRLIERGGALSTFYGNTHLGYAVGLYGIKEFGNLESIRRIRNVFAHAPSIVRFDSPEIVAECNKFTVLEHRRDIYDKAIARLKVLPPRLMYQLIGMQMIMLFKMVYMVYIVTLNNEIVDSEKRQLINESRRARYANRMMKRARQS